MDLIDGPTLAERLNQGPLSASQTAQLGAELAKTLAYVHSQGVVHRDVKPANILLDHQPHPSDPGPAWSAKLSDFGISRLLDGTRLTIHGTTVGTANYMSPEQAETGHTSTASDVYSLGLVLIESLTGQVVYPGSGIPAALARLHRPPVVPTEFGPDWTTLLTGMTERHPDARPSAAEVSDTLRQLQTAARDPRPPTDPTPTQPTTVLTVTGEGPAQTAVMPASPAPVATGPHRARSRRHRQLVGAAAVVGLLVVILALTLPGSSGIAPPLPAPSYPSVTGPLGSPIRHLEGTIP